MSNPLDGITPKVYVSNTRQVLTRLDFVTQLVQALITVGMVPQVSTWPYDPYDPNSQLDFATLAMSGNAYAFAFVFDYPVDCHFSVSSKDWRPCIVVAFSTGMNLSLLDGGWGYLNLQFVSIHHCIRRTDIGFDLWSVSKFRDHPSFYTIPVNGAGINIWSPYPGYANPLTGFEGSYFQKTDIAWILKDYEFEGKGAPNFVVMGWLQVTLSPGGLHVECGSSQLLAERSRYLSFAVIFGRERFEAYARAPEYDLYLNNQCPCYPLYLKSTDTRWNGRNQGVAVDILGYEKDWQYYSDGVVHAEMFNYENVNRMFPDWFPDSRPSPRETTPGSGVGVHILAKPIVVPEYFLDRNDITKYVLPVEESISLSDVRGTWSDVLTSMKFRLCDQKAPLGVYEDPISHKHWMMVPWESRSMRIGFYAEGYVNYTNPALYTMIPNGNQVSLVPGGSGNPLPIVSSNYQDADVRNAWTTSQDSILLHIYTERLYQWGNLDNNNANLITASILIDYNANEPDDARYVISGDLMFKNDNPDISYDRVHHPEWLPSLRIRNTQSAQVLIIRDFSSILSAGSDYGAEFYSAESFSFVVQRRPGSYRGITLYLDFRYGLAPSSTQKTIGTDVALTNLKIQRYRFTPQ